jgi:predicted DNA binding CopG/RHH family protein
MLASLAAPPDRSSAPWGENELIDDVAVLSYESALLAKARLADRGSVASEHRAATASAETDDAEIGRPESQPPRDVNARSDRDPSAINSHVQRKCASITIRLSPAECAQVRQRSAEAGVTVSAYLRSCVFEMETLRTQVKQTLTELRTARRESGTAAPLLAATADGMERPWWGRLWPPRKSQ